MDSGCEIEKTPPYASRFSSFERKNQFDDAEDDEE